MPQAATNVSRKMEEAGAAAARDRSPLVSLRREVDRLFVDFHPFRRRPARRSSSVGAELPTMGESWAIAPAFYMPTVRMPKSAEAQKAENKISVKAS